MLSFFQVVYYKEVRTHSAYSSRTEFNPGNKWLQIIRFFNHLSEWSRVSCPQFNFWDLKDIFAAEMTNIFHLHYHYNCFSKFKKQVAQPCDIETGQILSPKPSKLGKCFHSLVLPKCY